MQQPKPSSTRVWYPIALVDREARTYRVSFLIAEEATWDHRFHDLDGRELAETDLALLPIDHRFIQASCDHAVGQRNLRLAAAANVNSGASGSNAGAVSSPA